jgi:putative chitinase
MITLDQLIKIMPDARSRAGIFLAPLNAAMAEFGINTKARQAPFLAQFANETGQLASVAENLNYTPQAIIATFNRKVQRFTPAQAEQYGRTKAHAANQEMIANIAYANRMGNGAPETGDGWRHRGSGGIQLTGKDNQRTCAAHFGIPTGQIGEWLRTPEGACRSAAWFWQRAGCNEMADRYDFDAVSDAVNIGHDTAAEGDAIGYGDRLAFNIVANRVLA